MAAISFVCPCAQAGCGQANRLLPRNRARGNSCSSIPKSKASSHCSRRAARRRPWRLTGAISRRSRPGSTGPLGRITTEQLEQYLAELRAAGLSPATIARRVAAIRSFFRHQALLGARTDNPAAELDLPRRRRTLPRTLSPAEAERLVEAANGTTPRALRDRALVELLYGAGLRVSEAVGLQKSSVDLDARLVRCIGKGSKERDRADRAARPRRRSAATSHAAGRSSTRATARSSSSTPRAAGSRAPAPS